LPTAAHFSKIRLHKFRRRKVYARGKKEMKNNEHLYKTIYKTLPTLLILFAFYTAAAPIAAFAANSPVSKVEIAKQDDFDKNFRAGRDLIDKEEWARAAEKFIQVTEKYPDAKTADAALYWLAFCHKKQKQFKEAGVALDRLLEKFPASSWASDARVMRLEIGAPIGGIFAANNAQTITLLNGTHGVAASANSVKGTDAAQVLRYFENSLTGEVYKSTTRQPLEREDEIKIAAFQSLLAADAKRAIETMGEILKPDSKASETLKQEILSVLRTPRLSRSENFSFAVSGGGGTAAVGKEFAPLLRETLVKSFQNETNQKIRKEIIYSLSSLGDQSVELLKKLYAAESDREIKRAIINSFGGSTSGFYAFAASGAPARKIESDVLYEIVRAEKDPELRRLAFGNLQRFPGWAANEKTIDALTSLYDSDADEAFKISIIRAFASAKQNQATQKLMNIAKNDKSDKLRLEAIYSLRTSKNPEVLKFLEDLIK